jgi:hypothetical protein
VKRKRKFSGKKKTEERENEKDPEREGAIEK